MKYESLKIYQEVQAIIEELLFFNLSFGQKEGKTGGTV